MIKMAMISMTLLTSSLLAAPNVSPALSGVLKRLEAGEKQTVVLYGTSLTIGGEWAKAMKVWFDETYPGQVTFVNSGKGGANSIYGVKSLEERVLAHRPDFVLMEFSYNDAIDEVLSPEQAWKNLDHMVSAILKQNPETAVVLQTMNVGWDPKPDHLPFSRRARLEVFNENYRRYAKEHALPFIDHYPNWLRLKEQEVEKFKAYLPDGSHPTPVASLAVTWPSVKALLEAASGKASQVKSSAAGSGFRVHQWQRDPRNPVLPPSTADFDMKACMNPFVIRQGDEYFLFYAGGTRDGGREICLAICPVNDLTAWKRVGPLFPRGEAGSFDYSWCVLPAVHRVGNKWHLYYTGRNPALGKGLQCFTGIGLATSDDLRHWTRHSTEPVLRGDGFPEWPTNTGIAGGGSIVELPQPDGRILYRMYYTLPTGTKNADPRIDQVKHSVVAHSYDGITWFDKKVVLQARPDAAYEDIATIGLNVWRTKSGWRAIYAAIGTQFGYYSLSEATSKDGLTWHRGKPGENLSLAPYGDGWESKMVEYPHIIEEEGRLRLFYCGNGYGGTGIGTAVAEKLDE